MKKIERYKLDVAFGKSGDYSAIAQPRDFIEVNRWRNGEGYDIRVTDSHGCQHLQITEGEFKLIKKLIKTLDR